jgi:hypothetical protein
VPPAIGANRLRTSGRGTAGNVIKLITNQIWFINAAAIGEAFALGVKSGVDPLQTSSTFTCRKVRRNSALGMPRWHSNLGVPTGAPALNTILHRLSVLSKAHTDASRASA